MNRKIIKSTVMRSGWNARMLVEILITPDNYEKVDRKKVGYNCGSAEIMFQ